jgi:hypothetical protein
MQDANAEFCTINDGVNPWNIVYKIASEKITASTKLSTPEKGDVTYTTDMKSTIRHMSEHFVPDDTDNKLHRKIGKEIQETTDTADNKAYKKK